MNPSRLSLKWRLIFAFLAVSVMPVLVSTYIAASAIQSVFQSNLEQWVSEAARFLLNEVSETQEEAGRAARRSRPRCVRPGSMICRPAMPRFLSPNC